MASWIDTVFSFLAFGEYNTSLPTVASGASSKLQLDSRGRLQVCVSSDTATRAAVTAWQKTPLTGSAGLNRDAFVVPTTKRVRKVIASSGYGTARYFQLFDLAETGSLSSTVTIPWISIYMPAYTNYTFDFGQDGWSLSNGLIWACSSTPNLFTQDVSGVFMANAEFFA